MKNKVIIILLVLVIAIGAYIIFTSDFNFGYEYDGTKKLNITFKESFEISDVDAIIKEVLGEDNKYKIEIIDAFNSGVSVTTRNITDEQITSITDKLKEKYKTFVKDEEENKEEENKEEHNHENEVITVINMPKVKAYDLIKFYTKPVIIVTVISIIFLAIMNRKLGALKAIGIPTLIIIGVTSLYISAVAILRIPLNEYVLGIGMFVYIMSLVAASIYTKSKLDE